MTAPVSPELPHTTLRQLLRLKTLDSLLPGTKHQGGHDSDSCYSTHRARVPI